VSKTIPAPSRVTALACILAIGVLFEAVLAGGFLGGHHMWKDWHANLGDFLPLPPLASLAVGLALRRRQPEDLSMLATRAALLILVVTVIVTGHEGGTLLAVHIPAAVATAGLLARQATMSNQARTSGRRMTPGLASWRQ
jgi:hypothetical protein